MSTVSYWLDEADRAAAARLDGTADVAVVGGGITGCACARARRSGQARPLVRGARDRRWRERANGGSRCAAEPLPSPCSSSRSATSDCVDLVLDRDGARRARGARRRRVPPHRKPAAWPPTTRSATSCVEEYEALVDAGVRCRVARGSAAATRRPVPGGALPSSRRRPAAGSARPRLGRERPRRVSRSTSTRASRRSRTRAPRVVVATDGYPSGLLGELEGLIVPTRGQVIATEPIEEMLFEVPHYGRHGFDYWHQRPDGRIVAGGFRTCRSTPSSRPRRPRRPSSRTRSSGSSRTSSAAALRRLPVGRDLRDGVRLPARSSGRAGRRRALDGRRLFGPRERPGLRVGRLVARAILGDRDPLLDHFEPVAAPGHVLSQ